MTRLSQRYRAVYSLRVAQLRLARRVADRLARTAFASTQTRERLPVVVTSHGSLLRRRLGDVDPALQDGKVRNLAIAVRTVDSLLIRPGETLSFWRRVGPPSAARGYTVGLVLRGGRPSTGVGGGLCQLANLIHWMALHSPLEVVERHHHSVDPFPDDRRALPFGTGASVFYNYVDLRIHNPTDQPFQLDVWVTDQQLRGRLRTSVPLPMAYHLVELDHHFEQAPEGVLRCNEIWRRRVDRRSGNLVDEVCLMRNRSRVAYPVDPARTTDQA
jgi:vancomycin resistance protein VanW